MSPSPLLPAAEGCHAGGGGGGVGAYFTVGSLANFHSPSITLTNPSGRRLSSGFCRSVTFGFRSESISLPAPPSKSQQASGQTHLQLYIFLPNISRKLNSDQTESMKLASSATLHIFTKHFTETQLRSNVDQTESMKLAGEAGNRSEYAN